MRVLLAAALALLISERVTASPSVVLIKIGGSSITQKAIQETLNPDALAWFVRSIAESDFRNVSFIVVHGAGSFGHHTAKEFGLRGQIAAPPSDDDSQDGSLDHGARKDLMLGLGKTRLSVQKLNQAVISAFLDQNLAAVGISPCFAIPGLQAYGGDDASRQLLCDLIKNTVQAGLIPILHGDAGLYGSFGAGILSGDTLMEILGQAPWITHVVFITDVDGVYTADPKTNDEAMLLQTLLVDAETGEIALPTKGVPLNAAGSTHEHDVTGGLKTKLASAVSITLTGKKVTIVRCGSKSAEQAIRGEPADLCTVITLKAKSRPTSKSKSRLPFMPRNSPYP